MWQQIRAIAWAQFRTARNHLPRTQVGTVLTWFVSLVWYGIFAGLAVFLAFILRQIPLAQLREWLPVGLLGVFLFWQLIPLFTLSSGWSLQLNKLQIYPVSNTALFGIEVLLRFSNAPEMVIVLAGTFIGLLRHPDIPFLSPLLLFLFIPLNLFLSLGIREFILHAFARNRLRELFAIVVISVAVLPQLLARTALGRWAAPYFLALARGKGTPWREVASLSLASFSALNVGLILAWTGLCYFFARRQFEKGLREDEGFRASSPIFVSRGAEKPERASSIRLRELPNRLFADPLAALLQKEFQSLLRMPRFRILFGMACVYSAIIFIPIVLNTRHGSSHGFLYNNFLPLVTLYGLLILSDAVLLNVFGFDRRATQIYFIAPVSFETVLKAKNLTAVVFIALQAGAVLLVAAIMRFAVTPFNVANSIASSAVVAIFLLSVGNYTSMALARPIDPMQTFKKQAGGKLQLWLLLCSIGMFLLVGFGFLARWALSSDWAMLGVLALEFVIGLIVYRIAMQSAVERGLRQREQLLDALSKGSSPIGLGLS